MELQLKYKGSDYAKIMELLSKLDKSYYYPNFEATFKNFFGKTLKNLEKEFIGKIK